MIRHPMTERLCIAAAVLACALAVLLTALGIRSARTQAADTPERTRYLSTEYAQLLFDPSCVHELDIRIPEVNWAYMTRHAEEEVYVLCDLVIDGETVENVAIRPKGNSSLSAIQWSGSERFSFKVEFDHYRADNTYHGLDKLALNNMGQDMSCMKDHLTYRLMDAMGVPSPLSSYVQVKLNGEPFGLYLAVEAVEDSFAYRNYGEDFGNLYRPDCLAVSALSPQAFADAAMEMDPEAFAYADAGPGDRADPLSDFVRLPFEQMFGPQLEVSALKYVGDDPKLYELIFDSAVFDITSGDRQALVEAVRELNGSGRPLEALDADSLCRYFVVHNFVNNYDGYTGVFVHNFYLREHDGRLSLIPWDYNLAFGIFTLGSVMESYVPRTSPYYAPLELGDAMSDAVSMVNYPIDDPTISASLSDRPLLAALLNDPEALELYHGYYGAFLDFFDEDGLFERLYRQTWENIRPYAEAGQTLYEPEQVERAADTVFRYCTLRAESIRRQLDGTLPSTMAGQSADWSGLVETGDLFLGDSVTFDSLVAGLRSEDVLEILDAVAGDGYPHDSEGVTRAVADAAADPGKAGELVGRILTGSTLIRRVLSAVLQPVLMLLLSAVVLIAAVRRAKRFRRRRLPERRKGGVRDAVPS